VAIVIDTPRAAANTESEGCGVPTGPVIAMRRPARAADEPSDPPTYFLLDPGSLHRARACLQLGLRHPLRSARLVRRGGRRRRAPSLWHLSPAIRWLKSMRPVSISTTQEAETIEVATLIAGFLGLPLDQLAVDTLEARAPGHSRA
jgi:hypothetical protein